MTKLDPRLRLALAILRVPVPLVDALHLVVDAILAQREADAVEAARVAVVKARETAAGEAGRVASRLAGPPKRKP
jgi:hypothetical protein